MEIKLNIIASNRRHFEHICHMYRIEKDQVRFVSRVCDIQCLHPDNIIIFADGWWTGYNEHLIEEIEQLVKLHNTRRKKT